MKMVKLGDCCKIISGSTPARDTLEYWGGEINWFTPKDLSELTDKYIAESPEKITELGYKSCSTQLLPPNSLLFSSRAPIGHLAITKLPACTNQGFKSLVPNPDVNVGYLYYAIKRIVPYLQQIGNGATFKEISKSQLEKVEIPLPHYEIQKLIADALDKAYAIRQRNRQILQSYDQLSQSLFLEMFGDLSSSNTLLLKDLAVDSGKHTFNNGPFGSDLLTSELQDSGVPVIYIRDLRNGTFNWISNVFVTPEKAEKLASCKVVSNDVLIAKVGTPPGIAAVCPENFAQAIITQDVIRIRVDSQKVEPNYLQFWLNSSHGRNTVKKITVEGTRARFALGEFKKLNVPLPAVDAQRVFSMRLKEIERQRLNAEKEHFLSEQLFQSLLQKAFTGELFD